MMSPAEYRAALAALDITQAQLSRILGADKVTPNRWATGVRPVPRYVELLFDCWRAYPELIPDDT